MADNTCIARPYAKAVFEHACDAHALPEWTVWLQALNALISCPALQAFIHNPETTVEQHADAMRSIVTAYLNLEGPLPDALDGFLCVLAQNKRLPILPEVSRQFEALRADVEQRASVQVTSFLPLSQSQQKHLADRLSTRLSREVSLELSVDPTLLGGAIICANDWVIDASVRGQLSKLGADLVASLRG
jgi:F-type H+-transporting ATPase subunit delta